MRRQSDSIAMLTGALIAVLAVAGCHAPRDIEAARVNFYLSSPRDLLALNRVVFVEIGQDCGYPQVAGDTTEALCQAIQARKLFHLDLIDRTGPACRDIPMGLSETYTMQHLVAIREALKCDAVLFGAVTAFQPHPRMRIGLYLRLLDLRKGKLLWAVDHVWDGADKATEARIRDFFADRLGSGYDPVDWRLALMSPVMFERFAAYEVAGTLPVRGGDQTPAGNAPTRAVRAARRGLEKIGQGMEKLQDAPQEIADSIEN